jgi:NifU-like protein involved in Fe-S cluster formation
MDNPTCFWKQENALCGDFVEVYLKISPQGTIEAFSYQGDLAMHTLAASSLLAEYIC